VTSDVDIGWEDVLRRAGRRGPRVVPLAVATAAVAAVSAVAVPLLRAEPPKLAVDKITGPIRVVEDTRVGVVLVRYGRWRGHDGVCYLVPRVHAGCLLRGERTRLFSGAPGRLFLPVDANAPRDKRLFRLFLRPRFRVAYTKTGVQLIDAKGRPIER
jgi:hypothetical protein